MADGFLAPHVPQQSRRDKLRIHSIPLPLYEPSSTLIPDPQPTTTFSQNPIDVPDDASNPSFLCPRQWGYPSVSGILTSGCNVQGLSLSLSSRVSCHGNNDRGNPPFELNLESYGSVAVYDGEKNGGGGYTCEVPRSSGPLGPFTGYSSILRGSRFLKPAQKLLEELFDAGRGLFYADTVTGPDPSLMEGVAESCGNRGDRIGVGGGDGCEFGARKSRLISMLDELCRRYMQYYHQLQDVVSSFECMAGLGNAAPYVNLALKAMSKHFRCLKDDIVDGIAGPGKNDALHFGQGAIKNTGYLLQPVWRPQRGLPERAVAVLRAWLFEHFLHPYPTDTDKLMFGETNWSFPMSGFELVYQCESPSLEADGGGNSYSGNTANAGLTVNSQR